MDEFCCFECLYFVGVPHEEYGDCSCPFCSAEEVDMFDEACGNFELAPEFEPI